MATWTYRSGEAWTQLEATSWLDGLYQALDEMGILRERFPRIFALGRGDGWIQLEDPTGSLRLFAHSGEPADELAPGPWRGTDLQSSERHDIPAGRANLQTRLFMLGGGIQSASTPHQAARWMLGFLSQVVPCESGSVLLCGPEQRGFLFLATFGPFADAVLGETIGFEQGGIVAEVHSTGVALILDDVEHDARHLRAIDDATGYRPRSMLAVPMVDSQSRPWGVVELLDSQRPFRRDEVELAQEAAVYLATWLSAFYAESA